jgi:cobalt-zinc-cadmium efflux system outer membrane protein
MNVKTIAPFTVALILPRVWRWLRARARCQTTATALQCICFLSRATHRRAEENFGGTGSTIKGVRATEATLQLSQLIELGGKRAKRMRLAGLERELAGWDYEVKRLEVLMEAKKAFVDVLANAERQAFATDFLRLAEQVQRTVSERVKAGKVSPVEETRARVAVSTARLQAQQAGRSHEAAKKRLAASWGSTTPLREQEQR